MANTKHVQPFLLVGASINILDGAIDENVKPYVSGDTYATGEILRRRDNDQYFTVLADGIVDDTNFNDKTERFVITDVSSGGFFTQLRDTPTAYGGHAGKIVTVKQDESGLEFLGELPDIKTTFLELEDTPDDYTGHANKIIAVSSTEDGLAFTPYNPTTGVTSVNGQTGVVVLDAGHVGARPITWVPDWNEVVNKPAEFPPAAHTHTEYYTKAEMDALLADKASVGHTHTEIPNDINVTGNITTTGSITATGSITTSADVVATGNVTAFYGTLKARVLSILK